MSRKRRFGISIPEEVAISLDFLAERLNIDRSKLVCEAIKMYIRDHVHYLTPHECYGVITLISGNSIQLLKVVEEYKDIIKEYTHIHIDEKCINALVVSGPSTKIAELHRRLLDIYYNVRFIPLRDCRIDEELLRF